MHHTHLPRTLYFYLVYVRSGPSPSSVCAFSLLLYNTSVFFVSDALSVHRGSGVGGQSVVEKIAWWETLTARTCPINVAACLHTLCQEAFIYETNLPQQDAMKLFWLCNSVTSEMQKTQCSNANKIRIKFGAQWQQRVRVYGQKTQELMLSSPDESKAKAKEIGIVLLQTNTPVETEDTIVGFGFSVDGNVAVIPIASTNI